ncbi:hypothetical protein [Rothia aeria]|nr:hypothetical protein [Rothia aeria]
MGSILARGAAARTGQAGDFGMRDTPDSVRPHPTSAPEAGAS